ncbi:MAG TPA: tetratricopeptide repeat protein [Ruminococcus sp.]|nr:tetratricopeptide repeat protein [Ruminococcus sp.]
MKKITAAFVKFVNSFRESIIVGTACGVLIFYGCAVAYALLENAGEILPFLGMLVFCNVVSVIGALVTIIRKGYHKYDQDIIGNAFVGFSKKCRLFHRSVSDLFERRVNHALNGFKELEANYTDSMRQDECAILDFYLGRCYDIMDYSPNASMYYTKAKAKGFRNDILMLLHARCFAAMGDTDEAVKLYDSILSDDSNYFRKYVRTDMGRMYLKLNDGKKALKYFDEAINNRECYADALGGAAIAHLMLHEMDKGEELHRTALLNGIRDSKGYITYYHEIKSAVLEEMDKEERSAKKEDIRNV